MGSRVVNVLGECLLAERARWPLWLPVFLGLGIALYFAIPAEPPAWVGGVLVALAGGALLLGRGRALASVLARPRAG